MTPVEILAAINAAITLSKNLYTMYEQVMGNEPIPTWDELVIQNAALQAKIDKEKEE
jgi:hypothetical protein